MTRPSAHWTPRRISNDHFGIDIGLHGPWLLAVITMCCASGFALVGYDNGVMGGLIETDSFKSTFNHPDANTIGNMVSLYEIGCFVGAIATFSVGDVLGRRRTILLNSLLMIAGAIIQAASSSVGVMILGRIVSGLGMGAINSTVPMLQAETSPATSRGKLVGISLCTLNFGICISYWVDYAFNNSGLRGSLTWRAPVALQCVFIGVLVLATLVIPDSPRWLASKGREAEAVAVLERLHNQHFDHPQVQQSLAGIKQAIEHERFAQSTSWLSLIKPSSTGGWRDDAIRSRRRLLLACFIQMAQQLSGINALIYYAETLFRTSIGLSAHDSALMAGGLNMTLIVGSVVAILLLDRVGRKMLLLPCITGMSLVMAVQAGLVYKTQQPRASPVYGRVASAMLFIFELFFSIGFQATVWLTPSEILPLLIRTKGSALSTASNWICNFAVAKFTPSALETIEWRTYIIFAILNACWLPVIAIFLPETANKTLEQMDECFARDGWHIDASHAARNTHEVAFRPGRDDEMDDIETASKEADKGAGEVIFSAS